ncbi:MAG: hypothetical protein ACI37P_00580 [Eggerthellaceae bacterium]
MEIAIGIKLASREVPAKACMTIKKHTGLSLSEIKQRATSRNYIFQCPVSDDDGLHLINSLKEELKKLGVETELYEAEHEVQSELFDNLEQLHKEIDRDYY